MIKWVIGLLFTSQVALAGLPPTTSQDFSDSSDLTTFKYRFPNFTGTHIGTVFSLGVNSITGGGTGQITANAAFNALAPSQAGQTGNFLTTDGTNTSWAAQSGLSIGALDGNGAFANGASISANNLFMQSASNTNPGLINTGAQSIAGAKNFTGSISGELLSNATYFGAAGNKFYTIMTQTGPGAFDTNLDFSLITGNWTWKEPNLSGTYLVDTMLSSGQIFAGSASNLVTAVTPSGNITMTSTGVMTINGPINMVNTKITNLTDPTAAQDAATKNYVDTVASSLQPIQAVYAASTANIPGTYVNGVAGVGATFTLTATGALSLDGTSPPSNSRVLLKDQTTAFQNGVYVVTTVGSVGVSPVLTRATDYNTAASINAGDLIPVVNGTLNTKTSWLQTATVVTVGTDSLVFVEWTANPSSYLTKTNNLSDVAVSATAFANIAPTGSNGQVMTLVGGVWTAATPSAAGSGNLNAKFVLNDAVLPYINIDGPHYQVNTQNLSIVNISMLNSGISGTTVVQLNQYRGGAFNQAVTASVNASGGNPVGVAASLNQTLSLLAGDVVTVDISSTAFGAPEALTVEY